MNRWNLDKLGIVSALGAMLFLGVAAHYVDAAIHAQHALVLPGTQEVIRVDYRCPLCQLLSQAHLSNQLGKVAEIYALMRALPQPCPAQGHAEQVYAYVVFSRGPPAS